MIQTLKDVSTLYAKGINICVGCKYERYASCTDDRITECNKQLTIWKEK